MKTGLLVLAAVFVVFASACASQNQQRTTAVGAAVGAGSGAIIGHQFGEGGRDKGALIGGAIGATTGLLYGAQEDRDMNSNQSAPPPQQYQGGQGGQQMAPGSGGGGLNNPYQMPNPQYCGGQWTWNAQGGHWMCR
jgi:uncharacterized protein YcfJ